MRIDRDAAAVVGDAQVTVGFEGDVDKGRVPGDGLVHRIVDDLREQMVQSLLVRAADIHAGAAANRLEAFEDLDVAGGIAALGARGTAGTARRLIGLARALRLRRVEEIARIGQGLFRGFGHAMHQVLI